MPNLYIPPFHFINEGYMGHIVVYSTSAVNDFYGEEYDCDLTWVPLKTKLGFIQTYDGEYHVYFPNGTKMGIAPSKWVGAEGLLRLYIAQNRVQLGAQEAA